MSTFLRKPRKIRWPRYLLIGAGTFVPVFGIASYKFYEALQRDAEFEPIKEIYKQPQYTISASAANEYDNDVSFAEFIFGIKRKRNLISSLAEVRMGNV